MAELQLIVPYRTNLTRAALVGVIVFLPFWSMVLPAITGAFIGWATVNYASCPPLATALVSLSPPVVHRDFTPDNLILRKDGTLKVIDFNVAQQIESTATGSIVGKHAYLPPEQFRGNPVPQSDIYALGATLYYLLTGADPEPISESHPKEICNAISDQLDAIVAKATKTSTAERFATIEELAVALDYNVEEAQASRSSSIAITEKSGQRHQLDRQSLLCCDCWYSAVVIASFILASLV
jgi:serine/threonine protein kinase